MITDLTPAAVDTKTATRDFWARWHAYRRLRHEETRPDDPVKPDDVVEEVMNREHPFEFEYRYEIARDGQMLSYFFAATSRPGSPAYDTNKQFLWADASVHRDHRRRGIGRAWIPLALELMDRHGCTTLTMGSEEESGHAFLNWMGAEGRFSGAENRLELSAVDWAIVRRWAEVGPKLSPASKLEVYHGHLPQEMWEDYCPQFTAMLNTMPWEQMEHGEIAVTPAQLAEWYARMDIEGTTEYTMLTREPDGIISGITDMQYAPYKPTMIHQGFTGVRTDARGRGLGKWLKAAMLLHVREIYPKLERVVTENAGSNAPMLAINKKMGFREYRAGTEYQISRDALIARSKEVGGRSR
jgi:GNAT superfamily N-acetyltransferase